MTFYKAYAIIKAVRQIDESTQTTEVIKMKFSKATVFLTFATSAMWTLVIGNLLLSTSNAASGDLYSVDLMDKLTSIYLAVATPGSTVFLVYFLIKDFVAFMSQLILDDSQESSDDESPELEATASS